MRKSLFIFLLSFISLKAFSQTHYTEKDYARKPIWIQMIEDTSANYYEVEKAYNIYWQHHEAPEEEHDVIGEKREREKIPSIRKQRKIEREGEMRMAVRKYERWHERMLPYVQADGRILTPSERLAIWKANQK